MAERSRSTTRGSRDAAVWTLTDDLSVSYADGALYDRPHDPRMRFEQKRSLETYLDATAQCLVEQVELVSPTFDVLDRHRIGDIMDTSVALLHNRYTSNHIHISCAALTDTRAFVRFYTNWRLFEPVVVSMCDPSRHGNMWCAPAPFWGMVAKVLGRAPEDLTHAEFVAAFESPDAFAGVHIREIIAAQSDLVESPRRQGLNIVPAISRQGDATGHVEFRVKHGSSCVRENLLFIDMFARFVRASVAENAAVKLVKASGRLTRMYEKSGADSGSLAVRSDILYDLFETMVAWLAPCGDHRSSESFESDLRHLFATNARARTMRMARAPIDLT